MWIFFRGAHLSSDDGRSVFESGRLDFPCIGFGKELGGEECRHYRSPVSTRLQGNKSGQSKNFNAIRPVRNTNYLIVASRRVQAGGSTGASGSHTRSRSSSLVVLVVSAVVVVVAAVVAVVVVVVAVVAVVVVVVVVVVAVAVAVPVAVVVA